MSRQEPGLSEKPRKGRERRLDRKARESRVRLTPGASACPSMSSRVAEGLEAEE